MSALFTFLTDIFSAEIIALICLLAAVTSLWRWQLTHYGAALGWSIVFSGIVAYYVWLRSPYYVQTVSGFWIRTILISLIAPHLLINIYIIRRHRDERTKTHGG